MAEYYAQITTYRKNGDGIEMPKPFRVRITETYDLSKEKMVVNTISQRSGIVREEKYKKKNHMIEIFEDGVFKEKSGI